MTPSPAPQRRPASTFLLLLLPTLAAAGAGAPLAGGEAAVIERYLAAQAGVATGRVSVRVEASASGPLPPCAALEPFLPVGTRAWGTVTVGVRCPGERPWTRYLAARVIVEDSYLVAARALPAGHALQPEDLAQRTGDLTALPATVLTPANPAIGSVTLGAIAPGAALRAQLLRRPAAIRQGQLVRLTATGPGFVASTQARALTNAPAGAPLQVRTLDGRVLSGTAGTDGTVSLP